MKWHKFAYYSDVAYA